MQTSENSQLQQQILRWTELRDKNGATKNQSSLHTSVITITNLMILTIPLKLPPPFYVVFLC